MIGVGAGTHEVCAFAINVGPYGGTNPVIGCRTVTIDGTPRGNLEGATPATGGLRVTGWAIDADTVGPVDVHVYVDGAWGGLTVADRNRPDVGAAFPRLGSAHGFDLTVPTAGGSATCLCVRHQRRTQRAGQRGARVRRRHRVR